MDNNAFIFFDGHRQPHRVLALPMCAMATACLLARAGGLGPWPFVYAGTLGIALGSFQAANVAAWAHYFGRAHLGEIRGLTFVITIVGAALGPLPFGWAAERGGYGPVLLAGAVGCVRGGPREPRNAVAQEHW